MEFKHIGLFEGIGGFSYAANLMGWETIAWCEINPFGQQVLKYYYPKAKGHHDIKQTDFTIYRGQCDILTGGFPCQPYSAAGKRLGTEDDRHLWPEMLRAIREIQPGYVVGENVRGLTNWNGGLVFDQVQADLENEGYEVLPFLLPACAVNAPHRRDRIWFVAYNKGERCREKRENISRPTERNTRDGDERAFADTGLQRSPECKQQTARVEQCGESDVTNTEIENERLRVRENQKNSGYSSNGSNGFASDSLSQRGYKNDWRRKGESDEFDKNGSADGWRHFPTQSPLCSRDDGLSTELSGITFSKHRNESIKAYGNAIVPQLALQIFKAIEQMESLKF